MNQTPILIIGARSVGMKVLAILQDLPEYRVIGFIDEDPELGPEWHGAPVWPLQKAAVLPWQENEATGATGIGNLVAACAIGDPVARKRIWDQLKAYGWAESPSLIHPSVDFNSSELPIGAVVCQNCVVQPMAVLGDYSTMNVGAVLGPGAIVEDYVTVNGQTFICANSKVRSFSYIGVGAKILQGLEVAEGVTVGAGAVVTKDILEHWTTWAGVPARKIGEKENPFA